MRLVRLASLVFLLGSSLLACGDNKAAGGPDSGPTDDALTVDGPPEKFQILASFDPAMGQLPEGVVIGSDGKPLVSLAPLGQIVKVDGGTFTAFGNVGTAMDTFTLGLAIDAAGDVYVGVGESGANPTPNAGIYKIPAAGGAATLFASANAMVFPNALDFDGTDLYVTDSTAGRVFRVNANGQVTNWSQNALLSGDQTACGGSGAGFDIGANGIAHDANNRYVAVTDFGRILRIPINANGTAGTPVVVAEDCAMLAGADGIALDTDGSLVVVRNGPSNTMVRVAPDGTITPLHTGAPLDGPASVVIDGTKLVITSSGFFSGPTGTPSLVSTDK